MLASPADVIVVVVGPPERLIEVALGSPAIVFIGYSESLAAAKEEGAKYDYEIDASQEMVGQGAANGASGWSADMRSSARSWSTRASA